MTGSVTKTTPIQFTDGKSRINKRKGRKTALSGYYTCLSHDLLLMPSGADTHTHTNVRGQNHFKKPCACGPVACTPGLTTQQFSNNVSWL